jgi:hypothetical protein
MIRKESTGVNLAFNAQQYYTELTVGIDPLAIGEQYLNRRISSDLSSQTKTSKYLQQDIFTFLLPHENRNKTQFS